MCDRPTVSVIVGDDVEACRNFIKPAVALYVGGMGARDKNFYNTHISRQGWPDDAKKIQDLYLDGKKKEATAAVPDDMADHVARINQHPIAGILALDLGQHVQFLFETVGQLFRDCPHLTR